MSTSHVTYACQCLNVKVHLANKYYLESHEKFRREKFVRLSELPISGWQFELSTEGVKVEYASLIRSMRNSSRHGDWITFSCQNCNTGDVYSVKQPDAATDKEERSTEHRHNSPQHSKRSTPSSDIDQPVVIIHSGTIFGVEVDKVKEKSNYSHTFHIVLKPDLPGNQISLEEHDGVGEDGDLRAQHRQIQQLLKESIVDMEMATKERIETYKAEQELLLRRAKEKAMYDGAILWQTIKEATRTLRDKERTRHLSPSSQQFFSKKFGKSKSMTDPSTLQLLTDNVHTQPNSLPSRRGSVIATTGIQAESSRRNLAPTSHYENGAPQPATTTRRPSYILDEASIANGLKRKSKTVETPQKQHELMMPQFYRRRSSLAPTPINPATPNNEHKTNANTAINFRNNNTQHESSIFHNDFVHPLAQLTTYSGEETAQAPESDDRTISIHPTSAGKEEDKEHVFSLDEDHHDDRGDEFLNGSINQSKLRRESFSNKYIESDDEEAQALEEDEVKKSKPEEETLDAPTQQHETKFATSVPINIHQSQASYSSSNASPSSSSYRHPNAPIITVDNEKLSFPSSSYRNNQSFKEQPQLLPNQPTNRNQQQHQGNTSSRRRSSIFGIDYTAEADRRASLKIMEESGKKPHLLTDKYRQRQRSTTLNPGTASTTAALHNQPHYFTHSLDTRQQQRRSSISGAGQRDSSYEDEMLGPIIPPHILAANTYKDETEAMFGSVPRNSTRHRPLE